MLQIQPKSLLWEERWLLDRHTRRPHDASPPLCYSSSVYWAPELYPVKSNGLNVPHSRHNDANPLGLDGQLGAGRGKHSGSESTNLVFGCMHSSMYVLHTHVFECIRTDCHDRPWCCGLWHLLPRGNLCSGYFCVCVSCVCREVSCVCREGSCVWSSFTCTHAYEYMHARYFTETFNSAGMKSRKCRCAAIIDLCILNV
jgi:hypothetical protein